MSRVWAATRALRRRAHRVLERDRACERPLPPRSLECPSPACAAITRPVNSGDDQAAVFASASASANIPSVVVDGGHTERTTMPVPRNSAAISPVMWSSAALATPYGKNPIFVAAPAEETLTIRPFSPRSMIGTAWAAATKCERNPTVMRSSQRRTGMRQNASSENSTERSGTAVALLTSTSSVPASRSIRAKTPATSSSSRWSQATGIPRPPAASTSAAVSPTAERPVTYTVAPARASATATPRPIPLLAPVTRATRPSKLAADALTG